ncbi:MAG: hypothetical protein ACRC5C_03355, partial [Bacilli bacterium]
ELRFDVISHYNYKDVQFKDLDELKKMILRDTARFEAKEVSFWKEYDDFIAEAILEQKDITYAELLIASREYLPDKIFLNIVSKMQSILQSNDFPKKYGYSSFHVTID